MTLFLRSRPGPRLPIPAWFGIGFCRYSSTVRIALRPYQERCLDACLDALGSPGTNRIGVSLPTGSGKTTVFVSLISRIKPPANNPLAKRSLIVVNSVELAKQAANQVAALFPSWTVEIEQGTKYKASGSADVTVATIQTLSRPERLQKFDPRTMKAVIVDEAHHGAAPSYRRLLSHFDANIKNPDNPDFQPLKLPSPIVIAGFSATFSRHDGLALGSVFQRIVYHRDFLEMIKENWLCNVRFTSVQATLNLKEVKVNSASGDFNATSLAHVINTDTINHLVVQTWLDRAAQRRSTLVFCVNVAHVHALTQVFREFGVDARYVFAQTASRERDNLIEQFKAGIFPVLINCAVLTEGADIPNIDCVVIARPTRSRNVFAQMIGRGMRLSSNTGKKDCRVIDFVDTTSRVSGVISTPTLFGLDPLAIQIDDDSVEDLEEMADSDAASVDIEDNVPPPKSVTFIEYENPFALVNESSGAPHISKLSRNAWVGCGGDIYVLECLGKGHIRVEPVQIDEGTHFAAHFTPAMLDKGTAKSLKLSPFMRSRSILTAKDLEDAIRGSDTYAIQKVVFGPMAQGLSRTAKWRKAPATDSQKKFVLDRWKRADRLVDSESRDDKINRLTKGEAANIITRIKHGGVARYEKRLSQARKLEKKKIVEKRQQDRMNVKVGPLPVEA